MHIITDSIPAAQSPSERSVPVRTHRNSRVRRVLICASLIAITAVGLAASPVFVRPANSIAPITSRSLPARADDYRW